MAEQRLEDGATRRRRLTAEETRDRTCAAGLEALAEHGLSLGLDTINLEQAIRGADVSRSSAYAAWSTDENWSPQELFQRTVLKQAIADRKVTIQRTQAAAVEVIDRLGTDVTPAVLFRELARVTGGVNAKAVADSRSWQLVVSLRAVLNSVPEDERDHELADWVSESERHYREDTIETIYRPLADMLGLRPKPEYGDHAFHLGEIAAASLAEGLVPRYFMSTAPYLDGIERTTDGGEVEEWSLFSIMFEQIVFALFEPIDLDAWHGR